MPNRRHLSSPLALFFASCLVIPSLACGRQTTGPSTTAQSTEAPSSEAPNSETKSEPVTPPAPASSESPAPQLADSLKDGIDVSWHSGTIDWKKVVAEGHGFAFVKATEGMDLEDKTFEAHWSAMQEAGLLRGAYHFYITRDDPKAQAEFFIDTVKLESGDLVPVVDIETLSSGTKPDLAANLKIWLEAVEEHYGVKPIIYTARNFWDENLNDTFGDYPLWLAEYDATTPHLPKGWSTWTLWQWAGDATIDGVEKTADRSRSNPKVELTALIVP